MRGVTVWLTGLTGSGKTTIANRVAAMFRTATEVLDGDEVRTWLTPGLGYSRADREENCLRVALVCNLLRRNGVIVFASLVSPYRDFRKTARFVNDGRFVEVYVRCPLEVCKQRDTKGIYARAATGEIRGVTGVDDPYEPPEDPDVMVDTSVESEGRCSAMVYDHILRYWWERS